MPGIHDDPEFQAGRGEMEQHMRNGNPEWDGEPPKSGSGCSVISAILIGGSGVLAAYLGHKYGIGT